MLYLAPFLRLSTLSVAFIHYVLIFGFLVLRLMKVERHSECRGVATDLSGNLGVWSLFVSFLGNIQCFGLLVVEAASLACVSWSFL